MKLGLVNDPLFQQHDTGSHVENAGRLRAIDLGPGDVPPRPATPEEIALAHVDGYTDQIDRYGDAGGWIDSDTRVSPVSPRVARSAVGACIDLVTRVVSREFERGFALIRPPGHHATPRRAMGFCLFSNIAIAAHHARRRLGLERVFIFDWDVHHGNGTQDCVDKDAGIMFCSFHQWPLYPGSGWYDERGAGNVYNLPLPGGMGDGDYLWAFQDLVAPRVKAFAPQLVLVSAGYDAHEADPLGGMGVTTKGFGNLAAAVAGVVEAPLVGFLEGGYNIPALAASVRATYDAWSNPEASLAETARPSEACQRRVREAERYW